MTRSGISYAIRTRTVGDTPSDGKTLKIRVREAGKQGSSVSDSPLASDTLEFELSPAATECSASGVEEVLRLLHPGERATLIVPKKSTCGLEHSKRGIDVDGVLTRYEVELVAIEHK